MTSILSLNLTGHKKRKNTFYKERHLSLREISLPLEYHVIVAGGTASGLHMNDIDEPSVTFALEGGFSIVGTAEIETN